jgi:hypothetical protein
MGFGVGSYAKIWEVEDKGGKYAMCKISISTKNRATNQYETTFSSKVAFFNDAYNCRPQVGQKIKITNCDVTNKVFVKNDGTKTYPFQFSVFKYELQEETNKDNPSSSKKSTAPTLYEVMDDEGDIPF